MAFYGSDLISVGSIRELFRQRRNVEVMTSTEELQETVANKFHANASLSFTKHDKDFYSAFQNNISKQCTNLWS